MNQNNATNNNAAQVGEREIVITRVFEAPRDLVFDAWTKEEHLSKWWGPQGFTTTIQKFEMKPGGTWQFIMHSPDGVDFPNTNIFVEVVKPERIVIKHDVFPHFLATTVFEDLNGMTKLTYRTVFEETDAVFDKVKTYAVPGAEQTMDRLEEHLASMTQKERTSTE
ncbi:SRPBCC family protein [Brevibacillus panacihumi]|uniref:Polyketide cyclase n=1 Tax=Brevibacillus panacihumi TaxID=497735 RepID=A0A3M8CNT0_9BACL|nr:SRPBCC family protein [Brevibacillus panacihumi]RNB77318.1 polyketide cyclase [Brevibacillus panacihumi]